MPKVRDKDGRMGRRGMADRAAQDRASRRNRLLQMSSGPGMRLPALDMMPKLTDVNVGGHMDLDLKHKKQVFRLNSTFKRMYGTVCPTCWLADHPVAYVNMPCGHMTCCHVCGPEVHTCVKCRQAISSKLHWAPHDYQGHFAFGEIFGGAANLASARGPIAAPTYTSSGLGIHYKQHRFE